MKRLWRLLPIFLLSLAPSHLRAQNSNNLVYNPSFEEHSQCPERIYALGVMTHVDAWWQPTRGSSDYFNSCGGKECSVPRNKMGFQAAHSGNAYCGIYCSQENYREYLQTELSQPLLPGHTYRLSFYVSLAEKSPHAVASIGALLSASRFSDTTSWDILMDREFIDLDENQQQALSSFLVPQVQNHPDSILTDTRCWHCISGTFIADGTERFLTIGNFAPFNKSNVVELKNTTAALQGAYYYVDDVCLSDLDTSFSLPSYTPPPASEGDIFTLQNLFFASGQSDILPQSYVELRRLLDFLQHYPSAVIELRGHTDNQGTAEYNQRLSEARAKAVEQYLISHGISPRRLSSVGFGKTKPIASNDTPDGRQLNRRVEYRVIEN